MIRAAVGNPFWILCRKTSTYNSPKFRQFNTWVILKFYMIRGTIILLFDLYNTFNILNFFYYSCLSAFRQRRFANVFERSEWIEPVRSPDVVCLAMDYSRYLNDKFVLSAFGPFLFFFVCRGFVPNGVGFPIGNRSGLCARVTVVFPVSVGHVRVQRRDVHGIRFTFVFRSIMVCAKKEQISFE